MNEIQVQLELCVENELDISDDYLIECLNNLRDNKQNPNLILNDLKESDDFSPYKSHKLRKHLKMVNKFVGLFAKIYEEKDTEKRKQLIEQFIDEKSKFIVFPDYNKDDVVFDTEVNVKFVNVKNENTISYEMIDVKSDLKPEIKFDVTKQENIETMVKNENMTDQSSIETNDENIKPFVDENKNIEPFVDQNQNIEDKSNLNKRTFQDDKESSKDSNEPNAKKLKKSNLVIID